MTQNDTTKYIYSSSSYRIHKAGTRVLCLRLLPTPQTPPTTPTTAADWLPVCAPLSIIIISCRRIELMRFFSSLFSFLFRFFRFFSRFFLVFFFRFFFLFCSTNYLNFAFVRFCCVIWSMLSRNHKARLKIDKQADRQTERGTERGTVRQTVSPTVRQTSALM